jgi:transcriptional regulator
MRLRAVPQALVIFQGYNHYISPGHYPSKRDTGKVVPTWNYVNVQVRGPVHVHEDAQWVHDQVRHLSDRHEQAEARPWSVDDAPEDFMASQLRAIVGLDIEIAAIEGKFKLSQNKKTPDRDGVIAGLAALGAQAQDQQALDMAQIMRSIGKIG